MRSAHPSGCMHHVGRRLRPREETFHGTNAAGSPRKTYLSPKMFPRNWASLSRRSTDGCPSATSPTRSSVGTGEFCAPTRSFGLPRTRSGRPQTPPLPVGSHPHGDHTVETRMLNPRVHRAIRAATQVGMSPDHDTNAADSSARAAALAPRLVRTGSRPIVHGEKALSSFDIHLTLSMSMTGRERRPNLRCAATTSHANRA